MNIIQLKIFNNILDNLFEFLETTFPVFRSDIVLVRTATNLIRSSNPRLVVEQFIEYVGPYQNKIFECDEGFFINFEKDKNIKKSLVSSDNLVLGMRLRDIWLASSTTDTHKATVFLFFQKLITEARKVNT